MYLLAVGFIWATFQIDFTHKTYEERIKSEPFLRIKLQKIDVVKVPLQVLESLLHSTERLPLPSLS